MRLSRSDQGPGHGTRRAASLAVLALLCGVPLVAQAQQADAEGARLPAAGAAAADLAPVPWSTLSADQQKLLQRFEGNWDTLPVPRQNALARGSERWLTLTPEQRAARRRQFEQWRGMSDGERRVVRERWQRFKDLPPEQQDKVRAAYQRFQRIPPERRQKLRKIWDDASPAERQRMLQNMRERQQRRLRRAP